MRFLCLVNYIPHDATFVQKCFNATVNSKNNIVLRVVSIVFGAIGGSFVNAPLYVGRFCYHIPLVGCSLIFHNTKEKNSLKEDLKGVAKSSCFVIKGIAYLVVSICCDKFSFKIFSKNKMGDFEHYENLFIDFVRKEKVSVSLLDYFALDMLQSFIKKDDVNFKNRILTQIEIDFPRTEFFLNDKPYTEFLHFITDFQKILNKKRVKEEEIWQILSLCQQGSGFFAVQCLYTLFDSTQNPPPVFSEIKRVIEFPDEMVKVTFVFDFEFFDLTHSQIFLKGTLFIVAEFHYNRSGDYKDCAYIQLKLHDYDVSILTDEFFQKFVQMCCRRYV